MCNIVMCKILMMFGYVCKKIYKDVLFFFIGIKVGG